MSTWYPSLVMTLRLRFDEAFLSTPGVLPAGVEVDARTFAAPGSPAGKVTGPVVAGAQLPGIKLQPGEAALYGKAPRTQLKSFINQDPAFLSGSADDLTILHARIPLSLGWEEPNYRQAGTFKASIAWRDLPIDPQLVRACGVDIHLDTVSPDDFARGMRGLDATGGSRDSILTPTDDNLRMTGLVDEWETNHSANGDVVEISGRDVRCIFIDTPIRPAMLAQIDPSKPIDNVVTQVLAKHPFGSRFTVDAGSPQQWPGGTIPAPGPVNGIPLVRKTAASKGTQARSSPPGDVHAMSFWDLITSYCTLVGALPWISTTITPDNKGRFATIHLQPARSIFDRMSQQGTDPSYPPPFKNQAPRTVLTGTGTPKTINYRWMIYGRNLDTIKFRRRFSGHAPKIVECVSWNPSGKARGAGNLLIGRFPNIPNPLVQDNPANEPAGPADALFPDQVAATMVARPSPSGNTAQNDVLRVSVPGITDVGRLRAIAFDIFTEIAHGELAGTCETKDLASLGGDNSDPDLLSIRVGDPVSFDADARRMATNAPAVSGLTNAQSIPDAELEQQVLARVGDPNLAKAIVASSLGGVMQMQPTYRTSAVRGDWKSGKQGSDLGLSFDFQEYIVARTKTVPKNKTPSTAGTPVSS